METTTIELTKGQKAELDALKDGSKESYKDVLQRLIDGYESHETMTEHRVRELAREEINDRVTVRALE